MSSRKSLILLFLIAFNLNCFAQNSPSGVLKQAGFHDFTYDSNIRTARIYKDSDELSDPIILLRSTEQVILSFDDMLQEEQRRLYYTLTHCDADWNEESLIQNDYMSGINEIYFNSVNYSSNTSVYYINYVEKIPNADTRLKLSGNYLVKVYNADSRKLLLQMGFSVVESAAQIKANVRTILSQKCAQQLEFKVAYTSLYVADAFMDFKPRITQNSMRIKDNDSPKPAFVQAGNMVDYTRPDKNIFQGNNEFRSFDIRNLSFSGQGVKTITYVNNAYRVMLNDDKIKTEINRYISKKDSNGKYVIAADRMSYPNTEADYVDVYFTLVTNNPFIDGRVFIIGEFSNWNLDDRYEMTYSPESNQYELNSMFKQGYYNYQYIVLYNDGRVEIAPIEGCYAETENQYNIYMYYRSNSDRYDRLVGFTTVNSQVINK